MELNLDIQVFWDVIHVVWWIVLSVLEKYTAIIFKVQQCQKTTHLNCSDAADGDTVLLWGIDLHQHCFESTWKWFLLPSPKVWGGGGLNFKGSWEWKLKEVKVTIMEANGGEEF